MKRTPILPGSGPKRRTRLRSSAVVKAADIVSGSGEVVCRNPSLPGPLPRRSALRAFSPKRAANRPKRREVVAAVLERDGHRCQAPHDRMVGLSGCFGPLDVHELVPRSGWKDGYLVPANCLTVARSCHQWIDDHPTAAHALGLHKMSWERGA